MLERVPCVRRFLVVVRRRQGHRERDRGQHLAGSVQRPFLDRFARLRVGRQTDPPSFPRAAQPLVQQMVDRTPIDVGLGADLAPLVVRHLAQVGQHAGSGEDLAVFQRQQAETFFAAGGPAQVLPLLRFVELVHLHEPPAVPVRIGEIWDKDSREALYVRQLGRKTPQTYELYRKFVDTRPPEIIANIAICLIHQTNYLIDQQLLRLEKDFLEQGGLRERMTRARIAHRNAKPNKPTTNAPNSNPSPDSGGSNTSPDSGGSHNSHASHDSHPHKPDPAGGQP